MICCMARYVFISYSRVDKVYVAHLREAMTRYGIPTWLDTGIEHGVRWATALRDAIDGAVAVVVIMSPAADQSTWVEREIQRAEDWRKPIMPILLDGECMFRLANLQYDDVRGSGLPKAAFFDVLYRLVQDALDASAATGPPSGNATRSLRGAPEGAEEGSWPRAVVVPKAVATKRLEELWRVAKQTAWINRPNKIDLEYAVLVDVLGERENIIGIRKVMANRDFHVVVTVTDACLYLSPMSGSYPGWLPLHGKAPSRFRRGELVIGIPLSSIVELRHDRRAKEVVVRLHDLPDFRMQVHASTAEINVIKGHLDRARRA